MSPPPTTGAIVVDASVALSVVLDESRSGAVREAIARWQRERVPLLVPMHFWLEIANALGWRRVYRGAELLEAVYELEQIGLETVELDRPTFLLVLDLVERHGLTAYDAAYLAVAQAAEARLATADRALAAAAGSRAILFEAGGERRLREASVAYERDVTWPAWRGAAAYLAELRRRAYAGGTEADAGE